MGFNYNDLPRCRGCKLYEIMGMEKVQCSLYWRPGTGTKTGFPDKYGNECPRDSWSDGEETDGKQKTDFKENAI